MRKLQAIVITAIAGLFFMISGCATVADSIVDGAVSGLGRAVFERAENAVYKKLAPKEKLPPPKTPGWNQFMVLQAQIVFAYAYSGGGLWVGQTGYNPGEYTKFNLDQSDDDEKVTIERALLKREDDGDEWWRVGWIVDEDEWIYEALIDNSEGEVVRLRAKDANGNEGEIPVQEDTYVYTKPESVSEESLEGATIREEELETPAGTFNTRLVEYIASSQDGTIHWWITEEVPGGVAQYQLIDEDETVWTNTLIEMGDDATTTLSSF
ncbi:MAG: hypothetical protein GF313_17355 [Caldithrix sp.]|nr:hypothetical protein [Caldithrix sp.]